MAHGGRRKHSTAGGRRPSELLKAKLAAVIDDDKQDYDGFGQQPKFGNGNGAGSRSSWHGGDTNALTVPSSMNTVGILRMPQVGAGGPPGRNMVHQNAIVSLH